MGDLANRILDEVTAFFVASRDFNGLLLVTLQERVEATHEELTAAIGNLVENGMLACAFVSYQGNPHVLRIDPPAFQRPLNGSIVACR